MELTWPIIGFCGLTTAAWWITDRSIVVGLAGFALLPVVILLTRRRRPPPPVPRRTSDAPAPCAPDPEPASSTRDSSRADRLARHLWTLPDDLGADDLIIGWNSSLRPAPRDVSSEAG